jgi:DNA repair exonuclease SbcCD ATPase subunit
MNQADQVKVLAWAYATYGDLHSAAADMAREELHAAINAQQSIIDEQRAEIERLTTPAPVCPVCGSDCNERDELTKAEREIERLRKDVERLKASVKDAFVAGFYSPRTYNDIVLNTANECWEEEKDSLLAAGSQTELTPADVRGKLLKERP